MKINNRYEAEITRQKTAYGKIFTDESALEFSSLLILGKNYKKFLRAEKYPFLCPINSLSSSSNEAAAVKCTESDNKSRECLENHCQHILACVSVEKEVKS